MERRTFIPDCRFTSPTNCRTSSPLLVPIFPILMPMVDALAIPFTEELAKSSEPAADKVPTTK